ncbi:MAG TPA: 6-phosphogluconolactonase [Stenotrophobium sp.]|nr:6-phosphogluconolactonase [Stenotrophobium sp.]
MNPATLDQTNVRWDGVPDVATLHDSARRRILDAARDAIRQRGRFLIVVAGGNTPQTVYRRLRDADADWSRWYVYFGDERCVPVDDPARNSRMAAEAWLDHVAIPKTQVHAMPAELGAGPAADAYANTLHNVGQFDLVLLGLGEDGHTASLFPDHDWGSATHAADVLAVADAPKPPPQRVSLSARRLSLARAVLFMVTGEAKHDAVARWHAGADIPARAIQPPDGVDVLIEAMLLEGTAPE